MQTWPRCVTPGACGTNRPQPGGNPPIRSYANRMGNGCTTPAGRVDIQRAAGLDPDTGRANYEALATALGTA